MPLEISYKRALRGPCMRLVFSLTNKFDEPPPTTGEIGQGQFTIDNLVDIRLQFDQKPPPSSTDDAPPLPVTINISSKKTDRGNDIIVKLNVLYTENKVSKQFICTEAWTDWVQLGTGECSFKNSIYTLNDVELIFTVTKAATVTFADLYDDTDIVDFKLALDETSIQVHKACLAAHSSKLKTMFTSVWKDVDEGRIEVKGVTYKTLQHLKDYMYLGKLPDADIRPMLLFALHYSMQHLKSDCITRLVETADCCSLYNLLEFACEHNVPDLTFALMLQISDEVVHGAYELRNPLNGDTKTDEEP